MAGCFEAEASIAASNNDCMPFEVCLRIGYGGELVFEEANDERHRVERESKSKGWLVESVYGGNCCRLNVDNRINI